MCKVLNARKVGKRSSSTQVYIGCPSKLDNPFVIGRGGSRTEAIAKYRARIVAQPALMKALEELRGRDLNRAAKSPTKLVLPLSSKVFVMHALLCVLHFCTAPLTTYGKNVLLLEHKPYSGQRLYLVVPPSDISRTKPLVRLVLNQIGLRLTE